MPALTVLHLQPVGTAVWLVVCLLLCHTAYKSFLSSFLHRLCCSLPHQSPQMIFPTHLFVWQSVRYLKWLESSGQFACRCVITQVFGGSPDLGFHPPDDQQFFFRKPQACKLDNCSDLANVRAPLTFQVLALTPVIPLLSTRLTLWTFMLLE